FAPSCGTNWRPIPKTTAHSTNRKPNTHLPCGPVMRRVQVERPSAAIADRRMITIMITVMVVAMPNSTGRWNAIVKSCTRALSVAVPCAPRAAGALRAGGFTLPDLPSAQARQVLESELGSAPSAVVVVLHSDGLEAGLPAFETAAAAAVSDVASAPHVRAVLSHVFAPAQVSADRHTAYDVVLLDLAPDDSPDA